MIKANIHAVPEFFFKKGQVSRKVHNKMVKVLENGIPSKTKACKWTLEFKNGHMSIEDDPSSGCPRSATTQNVVATLHTFFHTKFFS